METDTQSITGITRGCGKRKAGGLYVCSGLSPFGMPLEYFIIDPPYPFDGEAFRSPILFEREGKNHIMMWVGADNYKYCSDFLEETRHFGVSKRIPADYPIEKLSEGSMMFLVHPKAIIENFSILPPPEYCPKENPEHEANMEYCIGHSYQIAEPTEGKFSRKIGDAVYDVFPCEEFGTDQCVFKAGTFLRMPITHFDHIKDNGRVSPSIAEKQTGLPINFEEE